MKKKTIKNPWVLHLNQYRKKNPKLSLVQAMKGAKKSYKPVKR
jgi:hypothetical protein